MEPFLRDEDIVITHTTTEESTQTDREPTTTITTQTMPTAITAIGVQTEDGHARQTSIATQTEDATTVTYAGGWTIRRGHSYSNGSQYWTKHGRPEFQCQV